MNQAINKIILNKTKGVYLTIYGSNTKFTSKLKQIRFTIAPVDPSHSLNNLIQTGSNGFKLKGNMKWQTYSFDLLNYDVLKHVEQEIVYERAFIKLASAGTINILDQRI